MSTHGTFPSSSSDRRTPGLRRSRDATEADWLFRDVPEPDLRSCRPQPSGRPQKCPLRGRSSIQCRMALFASWVSLSVRTRYWPGPSVLAKVPSNTFRWGTQVWHERKSSPVGALPSADISAEICCVSWLNFPFDHYRRSCSSAAFSFSERRHRVTPTKLFPSCPRAGHHSAADGSADRNCRSANRSAS
jgi:hypothetical protein